MKNYIYLLAVILALGSSTHAANTIKYACDCVDTGIECDGGEKMSVTLSESGASLRTTDRDGDFPNVIKGVLDKTYQPKKNTDFYRFKVTKVPADVKPSVYPYFLVKKNMLTGSKTGAVKKIEMANSGGGLGWEWYYRCQIIK